jgi:hypothetical protein
LRCIKLLGRDNRAVFGLRRDPVEGSPRSVAFVLQRLNPLFEVVVEIDHELFIRIAEAIELFLRLAHLLFQRLAASAAT